MVGQVDRPIGDSPPQWRGRRRTIDNDGNGTITITAFVQHGHHGNNLLIQGVMLDVSGASGPVTVTVKVTAGSDRFYTD